MRVRATSQCSFRRSRNGENVIDPRDIINKTSVPSNLYNQFYRENDDEMIFGLVAMIAR